MVASVFLTGVVLQERGGLNNGDRGLCKGREFGDCNKSFTNDESLGDSESLLWVLLTLKPSDLLSGKAPKRGPPERECEDDDGAGAADDDEDDV